VLLSRIRATMFGLLAVMLVGLVMAPLASAEEAGPFWVHRAEGGKGPGAKIPSTAPENFSGTGGTQTLIGKVGTTEVEFESPSHTVKGAIFNNALRGQAKFEVVYNQLRLLKPVLESCAVTLGTADIVQVKGFLAWKWNGEKKQLEEKPQTAGQTVDMVVAPTEPAVQTPEPEILKLDGPVSGGFTTITLKGSGCGVLAGTLPVGGSEVGIPEKTTLGEAGFSKELNIRTIPPQNEKSFFQHFWNGGASLGVLVGLNFSGNPASLVGQCNLKAAQQEVSVIE
jgi:hypothetical protein